MMNFIIHLSISRISRHWNSEIKFLFRWSFCFWEEKHWFVFDSYVIYVNLDQVWQYHVMLDCVPMHFISHVQIKMVYCKFEENWFVVLFLMTFSCFCWVKTDVIERHFHQRDPFPPWIFSFPFLVENWMWIVLWNASICIEYL